MRKVFATLFLALISFVGVFAQTNETLPCPTVSVTGPPGIPNLEEPIIFTAEIGKESEKLGLRYLWTITDGEIIEGQKTDQIKVFRKDFCEKYLTATVEISGLPKNCRNTASETFAISCCFTQPIQVDEFSVSPSQIDKTKLDNIVNESQKFSGAQIYIIENFARKTAPKTITLKNQKIIDYLKTRGVERDSITLINASGGEDRTQLF